MMKRITKKFIVISVDSLCNWRRRKFLVKSIPNTEKFKKLITKLSDSLKISME